MSCSDAIRSALLSAAGRLRRRQELAAEVAALEADEEDARRCSRSPASWKRFVLRGDVYRFRLPKGIGHEQHSERFGVVVQADEFLPRSVVIVAPTSRSARAASFRPEIDNCRREDPRPRRADRRRRRPTARRPDGPPGPRRDVGHRRSTRHRARPRLMSARPGAPLRREVRIDRRSQAARDVPAVTSASLTPVGVTIRHDRSERPGLGVLGGRRRPAGGSRWRHDV